MSDWDAYVRRFYTLNAEEQRAEWGRLTPDQRAQFEAVHSSTAEGQGTPHQASGHWTMPKFFALGCAGLLALGLLGVTILAVVGGLAEDSRTEVASPLTPRPAPTGTQPAVTRQEAPAYKQPPTGERVDAVELVRRYDENEIAADRQYKGRTLLVAGVVDNIGKDILGSMYVTLKGSSTTFRSVQCYFHRRHEEQLARLSPGQPITLTGRCEGLFGNVQIKDCQIAP